MKPHQITVCWGHYDENGIWHHNPLLTMTKEQQYEDNLRNGYPRCRLKEAGRNEIAHMAQLIADGIVTTHTHR